MIFRYRSTSTQPELHSIVLFDARFKQTNKLIEILSIYIRSAKKKKNGNIKPYDNNTII